MVSEIWPLVIETFHARVNQTINHQNYHGLSFYYHQKGSDKIFEFIFTRSLAARGKASLNQITDHHN